MATDDKIEELIREIAAKHGIAVGRDDPILILQTINMKLMQDSASAQQEILDAFKSELESIAHRWGDDAKGKAERTLNAALAVITAASSTCSGSFLSGVWRCQRAAVPLGTSSRASAANIQRRCASLLNGTAHPRL